MCVCLAARLSRASFLVWGFLSCCFSSVFSLVFLRCGGAGLPVCPLVGLPACRSVSCGSPCSRRFLFPSLSCVRSSFAGFLVRVWSVAFRFPSLVALIPVSILGLFPWSVLGFVFRRPRCPRFGRFPFVRLWSSVVPVVFCSGGFGLPGAGLSSSRLSPGAVMSFRTFHLTYLKISKKSLK